MRVSRKALLLAGPAAIAMGVLALGITQASASPGPVPPAVGPTYVGGPTAVAGPTPKVGPTIAGGPTAKGGPTALAGPTAKGGPTPVVGPTANGGPTALAPAGISLRNAAPPAHSEVAPAE